MEIFTTENHPKKVELGTREIPFTGAVYIDREDFFDTGIDGTIPAPKGYKRLLPGGQVRLKYTYVITCDDVIRDDKGEVVELVCSYDERTRAGMTPEGAKKVRLVCVLIWIILFAMIQICGRPLSIHCSLHMTNLRKHFI